MLQIGVAEGPLETILDPTDTGNEGRGDHPRGDAQ